MTIYPAGAPTTSGTRLTVDRLLKSPTVLAKRIVTDTTPFLSDLLFRAGTTESGTVIYSESSTEDRYPSRGDVKEVAPGGAFPMVDIAESGDKVALSTTFGAGYIVTDQARSRNALDVIAKGNLKVRNALLRQDAARCLTLFESKVPTVNSVGDWATTKVWKTDLLKGKAAIAALKLGYNPNTVLISPNTESNLLLLDDLQNWAPRENGNLNPLYNPSLSGLLGFNWIVNEFVDDDQAILLETKVSGVNVIEKPFGVEVTREGTLKRDVVIADKWSVPIIDEPGAALVINGIGA
ncbi:major capsid protein [Arthrobacter phage Vibaki]|uniref:Major capsid protein n=1 Tax=Arthrobacter phage Vibaki TaxID=2593333 RepID=A0A514TYX4_9CAUD|nr:major head protein [Arthrobacter phage Vibaki]QDK01891.1 major capsid protein [Arthrobacter phage Vibaki]